MYAAFVTRVRVLLLVRVAAYSLPRRQDGVASANTASLQQFSAQVRCSTLDTRSDRATVLKTTLNRPGNTTGIAPTVLQLTAAERVPLSTSHSPRLVFAISALISKTWLASNSNESLWRPFLATVDPISTLGRARLAELAGRSSCKQVWNSPRVTELHFRILDYVLCVSNRASSTSLKHHRASSTAGV